MCPEQIAGHEDARESIGQRDRDPGRSERSINAESEKPGKRVEETRQAQEQHDDEEARIPFGT
jgi:hypothetical protein